MNILAPSQRAVAAFLALTSSACSVDEILKVENPDIIPRATSAEGAEALYNGALLRFTEAVGGDATGDPLNVITLGGLLADEWKSGDSFVERNEIDARTPAVSNALLSEGFRSLNRVRVFGRLAIEGLREFAPEPAWRIGQLHAVAAFATNQIGETYCEGIPFSGLNAAGNQIVYGDPISTDSAFGLAVALSDSALATATGAGSEAAVALARVSKARALLNRGQFAAAAQVAALVPTGFRHEIAFSVASQLDNGNWVLNTNVRRLVVADRDGAKGLPFVSAADPRIPTEAGGKAFDTQTDFVEQLIWDRSTPLVVASGTEARLIESEAALRSGDVARWLGILNVLRAGVAGLAPLSDPGTPTARVDLLFQERAFWLFGTGHRLGDLRRLVRWYDRSSSEVFPTGPYPKGGTYGDATGLPIPQSETNNPRFSACQP